MRALLAIAAALAVSGTAAADQPIDRQVGFQEAATPVMEQITSFHDMLLILISAITLVVLGLLLFVIVRFNSAANPTPSKFSHNTFVEVIWTAVPVIILVVIAVPSFRLLYMEDVIPEADLTIKATGYQWYWEYEYPDNGGFSYASNIVHPEDAADYDPYVRNLTVTEPFVAPAGKIVRVLVTGMDVIHNWAMPSFGIKMDAIPGRLNETWFEVDKPGVYYGQCSELCGKDHAFMPIEVRIVPDAVYAAWVDARQNNDFEGAAAVLAAYENDRAGRTRLASAE